MTPRMATSIFLLLWIGVAILYDIWIYEKYGEDATITFTLRRWVDEFPGLLIILGGLLWHLFGTGSTCKP